MKSLFLLIATALTLNVNTGDDLINKRTSSCSADLYVEKNRNYKSADESGAQFKLVLKNTSGTTKTYAISATNTSGDCSNTASRNSGDASITLKASILDGNRNAENTVTLRSNETYYFTVLAEIPEGTPYYRWGCIEVNVKANDCDTDPINTILSVYIPNPSEG